MRYADGTPLAVVRLRPGLAPLWRDARTVQVGLDPRRALIATGVIPDPTHRLCGDAEPGGAQLRAPTEVTKWLEQAGVLDREDQGEGQGAGHREGHLEGHPAESWANLDTAARARFAPEQAVVGLTHPHPGASDTVLLGRRRARALVIGGGRVGATVAHLLAASGLGRVTTQNEEIVQAGDACPGGLSAADVGLRHGAAATALAVRALPPALPAGRPDVVVLAHERPGPYPDATWRELRAGGATLLPVELREGTVVVGPMWTAGQAGCPACVDRHRSDRDPCWPALSAQLALARNWLASTAGAVQVWAAAAAAVAELLEFIDGQSLRAADAGAPPGFAGWSAAAGPVTAQGYSLELDPPGWSWHRRFWGAHPECSCSPKGPGDDRRGMMGRDQRR